MANIGEAGSLPWNHSLVSVRQPLLPQGRLLSSNGQRRQQKEKPNRLLRKPLRSQRLLSGKRLPSPSHIAGGDFGALKAFPV